MADLYPPNGLDWADGLAGRPGTPTDASAVQVRGGAGGGVYFEEEENSPEIERGEQGTIRHSFRCDYSTGVAYLTGIGRGTIFTDTSGNVTKVLTCTLTRMKGNSARLVIISESISFDSPPDDFEADVAEFNTAIEKHPYFADLFNYNTNLTTGRPINTLLATGAEIIAAVYDAHNSASKGQAAESTGTWTYDPPDGRVNDPDISDLAEDLLTCLQKKIETFQLSGWRVVWSRFFFQPPPADGGGYVQDPVSQGGLPPYFWSTDQTPSGDNIFLINSALTNPAIYGGGLSWLRHADKLDYSRTWFRLTSSWTGGPLGHWESPVPYPPAI